MIDDLLPKEITLTGASEPFIATTSTESGEHITPLHRYMSIRLVIEGGFFPQELSPTPPLTAENRNGSWYLSFAPNAENKKEQIVLGALKSKRIDIVVVKKGIGPVLAISVKGTSKAFRNLVNRTEEAIGDCANIHIMYPGLVYGFVHFLRAADMTEATLKTNDAILSKEGDVIPSVKDYARILERLSGRTLVRNEYSRYEAVALALLKTNFKKGQSPLHESFPDPRSDLSITRVFSSLYQVYDLRYSYAYTDPGVRHLMRVAWHPDSQVLTLLKNKYQEYGFTEYLPRVSAP